MKIEFSEFFEKLIEHGKFNPSLKYADAGLKHTLPTRPYADRLHAVLCENGSDTIKYKGALYSMFGDNLISNKPFNVKGFTGDMNLFNARARKSMAEDIIYFKAMLKSWEDIKSFHGSISSNSVMLLNSQNFDPAEFAERLVGDWIEKAMSYIESHLAYNLIDKKGFVHHSIDVVSKQVFGLDDFSDFGSAEKLEQLTDAICFKKLKDWVVSVFDEDQVNESLYESAGRELCDEFVNKTTHKAFDKYKLSYYVSSYSWEPKSIGKSDFNGWFKSLRIACVEQGLADWYSDFASGCAADFQGLLAGDSVVCGGVQVRVYKSHITLSLPKKVSVAIGVFINKYASDTLKRKVA